MAAGEKNDCGVEEDDCRLDDLQDAGQCSLCVVEKSPLAPFGKGEGEIGKFAGKTRMSADDIPIDEKSSGRRVAFWKKENGYVFFVLVYARVA